MPAAYRIRNWDMHFENSESRKVKHVRWVPTPNRFDGKGFRRLAKKPNASDIFTGWVLMFQAASRMPVRGLLVDEDGPLTVDDLADMTGFARNVFVAAVEALVGGEINWLEVIEHPDKPGQSPGPSGDGGVEGRVGKEGKAAAAGAAVTAAAAVLGLGVFDEAFAAWVTAEYPPERIADAVKVYSVRASDPDPRRRPRNPAGLFRKLLADGCTPPPPPQTKGYAAATSKRTPALSPAPGAAFPTPDPSDPKAAEKIAAGEAFIAGKRRRVSASTAATTEVKP